MRAPYRCVGSLTKTSGPIEATLEMCALRTQSSSVLCGRSRVRIKRLLQVHCLACGNT